jgi:hypothetical protein
MSQAVRVGVIGTGMIGREQPVRFEQLGDHDFELLDQSVQRVGPGREAGHVVARGDPDRGFRVPDAPDGVASFGHDVLLQIRLGPR